jgi:hypothetical protein
MHNLTDDPPYSEKRRKTSLNQLAAKYPTAGAWRESAARDHANRD